MDRNYIAYLHTNQSTQTAPSVQADARSLANASSSLPTTFCWTRIGAEAGQPIDSILRRKEWERRLNCGHFVWGIGNSVLGQMEALVRAEECPKVVFSRMKSTAQQIDADPACVLLWTAFRVGHEVYDLPPLVLLTSRGVTLSGSEKERHYALFCRSSVELGPLPGVLNLGDLENLASANPVGFSQVTAVVKQRTQPLPDRETKQQEYKVDAIADLVYPFCAQLKHPVELSTSDSALLHETIAGDDFVRWKYFVATLRDKSQQKRQTQNMSPMQDQLF